LAALAYFMYGTGARRGEACAMLWRDVDLFAKQAVIHQTKVEDTRTAHMPQAVIVAIANSPSNRKEDDTVFSYASGECVGQVWGNVCKRAGIPKLTPHSCRHGFATSMLQAGEDPKTVAACGGWEDVGTVMKHYAHAKADPTVTDVFFGTKVTQDDPEILLSNSKKILHCYDPSLGKGNPHAMPSTDSGSYKRRNAKGSPQLWTSRTGL
jgi:hypothetical protein